MFLAPENQCGQNVTDFHDLQVFNYFLSRRAI